MRNRRLIIVITCAVVFGLIAAFSVSRMLSSAQAYTSNLNNVVVAKVDIPIGSVIIAEQLTTAQFPRGATPDAIFDTPTKLVGRVAIMNIAAREPLTDYKLAAEGSTGGLSAIIPEGYRAMTVKVDDIVGISGFIMPGTTVDVVVVITPADNTTTSRGPISKIVLQNIRVLASGTSIDTPKSDRDPNSVRAVTLQVTPQQTEKLALAATEGKLQLVMRNSIDQYDEQTRGSDKRTLLLGEHALPLPEAGILKNEQAAPSLSSPRRRNRVEAPRQEPRNVAAIMPVAPPPPSPRRTSIEMFEGAKKRTVDFP